MARDRDLVEAAQRGDQAAFVDLVRSTGDRLFALAYRILRDIDRTEDALQDAMVIAWRDLRGLRDPDRFDAWINRVVTIDFVPELGEPGGGLARGSRASPARVRWPQRGP